MFTKNINNVKDDDEDNNRSYNIKDNEQSGKVNWWINELDSLGIKKTSSISIISNEYSSNKMESVKSQQLEALTDNIKQSFIRDYKTCYSN
jgi:hypothetical protein